MIGSINRVLERDGLSEGSFLKKEDSVVSALAVLTLVVILFCSGSAAGLCYSSLKFPMLAVTALVWIVVLVARRNTVHFGCNGDAAFLLLMLAVVIGTLYNNELRHYSFAILILVLFDSFLVYKVLGAERVLSGFVRVMVFLGAVSVVAFLLFVVTDHYPPLPSMATENGKTVYLNGFIFCIDTILNEGRSIGIFWEPSIMAGYTNLALLLILVFGIKGSRIEVGILFAALICTLSSGGLIGAAFVLAAYMYKKNGNIIFSLVVVIAIILFSIFTNEIEQYLLGINYDFFFKFFGGSESGTTQTRLDSPLVNMKIWALSPLFGSGLDGASALYSTMRFDSTVNNMAQTSTVTIYVAAFGVLGLSYTVAWVAAIFRHTNLSLLTRAFSFAAFMLLLNQVPCTQFMSMYLLLFALSDYKNKETKQRRSIGTI